LPIPGGARDGASVNSDILGRYRLLERIGIGGMAEVFLARAVGSASFSRAVVVKRMLPQLAADDDAVGMFLDEARLGAKLQHPHIVGVVDLGEADGDYFMVLDYVDGMDVGVLQSRARSRGITIPVEHAAHIVAKAAQGLHFAHTAKDPETKEALGVVHRDMSPSNILISRLGEVKVADFGVARSSLQTVRTGTGAIKGKISYMSPEQLTGDALDARSDVYALGIVLWELLAGQRLHEGKNDAQVIHAVQVGAMPAPSTKNPAVPPALDALVASCLAKDPAARPQSAGDVANALEVWLSGQPQPGRLAFEAWLTSNSGLFEQDGLATAGRVTTPRRTPVSAAKPISAPSITPAGDQPMLRKVRSMSMGASSSLPSTTPLTSTAWTSSSSSSSSSATPSPSPLASAGGLSLAMKGPERKRSLVLYVEDEPENREVAELRLRRSYDLLLAPTDEVACTMLRERGPELSAILMDIQLKGSVLDGIELVKLVRGTLPDSKKPPWAKDVPVLLDLPIFFVTAYGARYAEAELLAVGAQKLVTKPVNFSELTLALVDVHLRRAGKP